MKLKLSDYGYTILMIETKLVCNMRCTFCAYPLMDTIGAELPDQDIYHLIDSIDPSDSHLEAIYFQKFNEPLLDKRIFDFIRYAKDRGFNVQIITNGLPFASKEIREKLLASEPTRILISLQVIDKDTFAHARGISSSFEDYKKGIFSFLNEAQNRSSSTLITLDVACNFLSADRFFSKTGGITRILGLDRGDPSVPDTIEDIRNNLTEFIGELHTYNPAFSFDEDEIKGYLDTVDPNYIHQEGLPISKNISIKVKQFIHGRKLTEFYPVSNAPGCETGMLSVDANGSVTPCCLAYGDMLTLGNIKKDSLKDILERTAKFVEGIRTGKKLPGICMRCHGEPTRRGTLVASVYWALHRRLS
jgi:radical SAM protein with 4Fe4S-binding SPASM domain